MQTGKSRNQYEGHLEKERPRTDQLGEDHSMQAMLSADCSKDVIPMRAPVRMAQCGTAAAVSRRRRISVEAGHGLELLGHAIEYLTDEYVHAGGDFSAADPRIEAIQLLMALNRQIYFDCPEVPSLGERCLHWLHRRAA